MPVRVQEVSFPNAEREKLYGVLQFPEPSGENNPYPLVLLGHGFGGSSENTYVRDTADLLSRQGIASLRFDFSGHGQSEGKFSETTLFKWKTDICSALSFARNRKDCDLTRIGLFGFSLSGGAAVLAAAEHNIKTLCIAASVSDFSTVHWASVLGISLQDWKEQGTAGLDGDSIAYAFYESGVHSDVYAAAKKVRAKTLVLHGEKDTLVPPAQSQKLFDSLQCEKTINFIKGAGHSDLSPDQYAVFITRVLEWFVLFLK